MRASRRGAVEAGRSVPQPRQVCQGRDRSVAGGGGLLQGRTPTSSSPPRRSPPTPAAACLSALHSGSREGGQCDAARVHSLEYSMESPPPPPQLTALHACSVQPLEDGEGPRNPLLRQVSLDEERRDQCAGHWRPACLVAADSADPAAAAQGVRLFRALLLHHLRYRNIRPPSCALAAAAEDPRGWWWYWREWRTLERAARRFRASPASARLEARAADIPLLSLDEVAFEDIMQELCQECERVEERALCVLVFLCEVCARATSVGGWCRAADWAATHVALRATPWAIRHGGWGAIAQLADTGGRTGSAGACGVLRREEGALLAGAAAAALLAFLYYCRRRLLHGRSL